VEEIARLRRAGAARNWPFFADRRIDAFGGGIQEGLGKSATRAHRLELTATSKEKRV